MAWAHGNAFKVPKPNVKPPKPAKLSHIGTSFAPGKATFTHHFTDGSQKDFTFRDPAKAASHIERAIRREWLHPDVNEGAVVARDLNLG